MRIDWNQRVADTDPLEIRNVLRRSTDHERNVLRRADVARALARKVVGPCRYVSRADVARQEQRAERLLSVMAASGLVGIAQESYPASTHRSRYAFSLTPTGRSLLASHKAKRMPRARAEELLALVVDAARAVNEDPVFHHTFADLAVYGSYVAGADDLGDLDIAYRMAPRPTADDHDHDDLAPGEATALRAAAFEAIHPAPSSRSIDSVSSWSWNWSETIAKRRLRVSRAVSIVDWSQITLLGCPAIRLLPRRERIAATAEWTPVPPFHLVDDDGSRLTELRDETSSLIRNDPRYREGSGVRHSPID